MAFEIVVIGTSWGGLSAVRELAAGLPEDFVLPLVLVQHRHRASDHLLAPLLQDRTSLRVCEVEDKSAIEPGTIYVAPPDYHLLVEDGSFALSTDEPVRYSRPSIDVTFESVADTYGPHAVGVVLTGANADGSLGLKRIHDRGGLAFIQAPETAESPTMPSAAVQAVPGARVLTIPQIAAALAALTAAPPRSGTAPRSGA